MNAVDKPLNWSRSLLLKPMIYQAQVTHLVFFSKGKKIQPKFAENMHSVKAKQMKSSSKRTLPVSPCEAVVADISALLGGHAVRQRLGDVDQLPLTDPDCRPQTITFAGTDEALQLRGHFHIHVKTECCLHPYTHALCVMTPYRRSHVRLFKTFFNFRNYNCNKNVWYSNDNIASLLVVVVVSAVVLKKIHLLLNVTWVAVCDV